MGSTRFDRFTASVYLLLENVPWQGHNVEHWICLVLDPDPSERTGELTKVPSAWLAGHCDEIDEQ